MFFKKINKKLIIQQANARQSSTKCMQKVLKYYFMVVERLIEYLAE